MSKLAPPGRRHREAQSPAEKIIADEVDTPPWAAEDMIRHFSPSGVIMEPCRGNGAIFRLLPPGALWCEIKEGVDFLDSTQPCDWIITNPPFSQFRPFMVHSFKLAANVVLLIPARNWASGYGTVCEADRAGFGLKEIRWYGTGSRLGFPMGNAVAAFHWQKGWTGPTDQSHATDQKASVS